MSIVRISAIGRAIHGVHGDGSFVHEPYARRRRLGRTLEYLPPRAAGDGLPPLPPGAGRQPARELDRRGFPRRDSDLDHLLRGLFEDATANLGDGPVVVMAHGFLFDPRDSTSTNPADSDNAHSRLYHFHVADEAEEVRHHTSSWPVWLGFSEEDRDGSDGMMLAYAWHSRPGFASSLLTRFQNFYKRAYDNAEPAAWNLLTAIHVLDEVLPKGKRIDFFCHSLGSRIVIRLLALAAKHGRWDLLDRIERVVILGGAEFVVEARLMLRRLHAAGYAERIHVYNVVSRENDVLDLLAENFGGNTFGNSNVIGHNGLDVENPDVLGPGWLDLQIDGRDLQAWMADRGVSVTGDNPDAVWDHWYYFTDRSNMDLYRRILRQREAWNIPELRAAGIPDRVSRRRSVFGD